LPHAIHRPNADARAIRVERVLVLATQECQMLGTAVEDDEVWTNPSA